MMTAVNSRPLKRCSKVPASSSIANTTPASGVLNAAAMPTAPPARMKREAALGSVKPKRRSEEHTSELQSLMRISYAVFCLKKKNTHRTATYIQLQAVAEY